MKKILIISTLFLMPLYMSAQTKSFRDLYDKYTGKEDYVTIEMSGEMFKTVSGAKKEQGYNFMDQIDNLVIIVAEAGSESFESDTHNMLVNGNYKSISKIRDGGQTIGFYLIKRDEAVVEFVMTVFGDDDYVVMSIAGKDLNVSQITQFARRTQDNIID